MQTLIKKVIAGLFANSTAPAGSRAPAVPRKTLRGFVVALATAALLLPTIAVAQKSDNTLKLVKEKGFIQCGVSQGIPGFSAPDAKGKWTGIDVDFCRALAAAIFATPDKVRYTPLSAKERFTALQSGEIDILSRNTTWTMQRDVALGLSFAGVLYYDGQGFMVRKKSGITSVRQLDGASVCTNAGTTTEVNVADYFRANKMSYELITFEKADEALSAYEVGRCDVYTTDVSGLYSHRLKLKDPEQHTVLAEIISKEPLGPVVRQGDDGWADIVRWTLNALITAEELGVTKANVMRMEQSSNPKIARLLGKNGSYGKDLGLDNTWARDVIRAVGNYGEMFETNVGKESPLGITRGLNALWTKGGLQYAPPIR